MKAFLLVEKTNNIEFIERAIDFIAKVMELDDNCKQKAIALSKKV